MIDGNFPDFRAIVPKNFKTRTILSTPAFLKACKQAEIIAREGNNVIRLNITPGETDLGQVEINAQTEETGKSGTCLIKPGEHGPAKQVAVVADFTGSADFGGNVVHPDLLAADC